MSSTLNAGSTLILGGAKSGKSLFAENLILSSKLKPVYLATGRAFDDEMSERIQNHQDRRVGNWETVEEPLALSDTLLQNDFESRAILIDCLTLWVTNLMMAGADVHRECAQLVTVIGKINAPLVFVSNEVGLGIVPENQMSREFRDFAGHVNQEIAKAVDEAHFIAAGLPIKLK